MSAHRTDAMGHPASQAKRLPATDHDILIIGGGPAGIATALALSRSGRRVAVIERTRYDGVRIGETLAPRARPVLGTLGLPTDLHHDGHIPAPGVIAAWGDAAPRCNDFIVNPYGNGWHLDRPRFDRMLAARARDCGIAFREGTTLTALEPDGQGWCIGLRGPAGDETLACRFAVDATGRRASPIKRQAGRRTVHDGLIGVAAFASAMHTDRRTLIEATRDGWWYSTPLPDDRQVAVYMTDADTIARGRGELGGFLQRQIRYVPLTRERCGDLTGVAHIEPFAAMTCEYECVHGDNWLLVGDAAMTWDPLSGQGICKALESGMHAARAIDKALDGDGRGLASYANWTKTRFNEYMVTRTKYYQAEQRWPDSPFWRRRHLAS